MVNLHDVSRKLVREITGKYDAVAFQGRVEFQLRLLRNEILEETAKVCEGHIYANTCVRAIRLMKEKL